MDEIAKLNAWMASSNLTMSQLATEIGIPYINAYMCIERRKRLSANFELAFRRRFGPDVADSIFDAPAYSEKERQVA